MRSELPIALNVFDTDYQVEYSENYSSIVHQETDIERYQYCWPLYKEPLSSSDLKTSFGSDFVFSWW